MRWTKRLKWIKLSKIVIPIALAISIVFAGFSVFANEAKNFVIDINNDESTSLSLTYNEDLSELTDHLEIPVLGRYRDVTWDPASGKNLAYTANGFAENIPDDIALQEGVHSVFSKEEVISFFSFSFYLVNNSNRAVTINMSVDIDEVVVSNNANNYHIDEAVRFMIIDGKHRLSENSATTVYKKAECDETEEQALRERTSAYSNDYTVMNFVNQSCILERNGEYTLAPSSVTDRSNVRRFTVVVWLEGWDRECVDEIIPESMKMSMTFSGV